MPAQGLLLNLAPEGAVPRIVVALFIAGTANGLLNAALGRQAGATVPADWVAVGSGANNTARYLGSAIGITLGAVLIAHGDDVESASGLVTGWNQAVLLTTGFSVLGAAVVALARGSQDFAPHEKDRA
ncbi:hypothetical protein EV659_1014 [Rhodothalassium salexigens DSM 2132]|uniref:MFS transporter n=1 Tax=Rhodothalassium salexigens DSM 2132 TaxID=1188247 RepID=A0A4R2PQP0_RHOSA|nr:hypothetical protein EV659_1014 [Rhodothalassium salexigens DSM 2132]